MNTKFEYGFNSVNGIVKRKYYLHEIPFMHSKCDVWNILPIVYVRQFTNFKNKNDIEIYSGDILSKQWKVEVYFEKGCWMVKFHTNPKVNKPKMLYAYINSRIKALCPEDLEIVGNIFENANLLQ